MKEPNKAPSIFKQMFRLKSLLFYFSFLTVVFFQNCAETKKKKEADNPQLVIPSIDCAASPSSAECLPKTCQFDGNSLNSGISTIAYQNSTVPFGSSCVSENRICQDGALSGSYAYAACTVDTPASCLFDSRTIEHGENIVAYQNSVVSFGSLCVQESRTCNNGSLSGSYSFNSCTITDPANCLFNGQTIQHNAAVAAFEFSTVPYGSLCQQENRVCNNGALTGSKTFASCNVEAPQSCMFNGETVAHGQNVVSFQTSSVPYGNICSQEIRTCDNGILSGQYEFASCNIEAPASCLFNGQTIANGQNVEAYFASSVSYGMSCQAETRTCSNGTMSGSFSFNSCSVEAPAKCHLNGQEVVSGSSITAFQTSSVPFGQSCVSESRICENGMLSGSYQNLNCTGSPEPTGSCNFNDQLILNSASITAYQIASVPYGMSCPAESRTCTDGNLTGSFNYASCAVSPPASCTFNGQIIESGTSITAYKTSAAKKGVCETQRRTCTNGSLSGSYKYSSCN